MFGIPFLSPGLLIKTGAVLAAVAAVTFAGWEVVHTIQVNAVQKLVAQNAVASSAAVAQAAVVEAKQADVNAHSADVSAVHQTTLARQAAVVKAKVHKHVHEPRPASPGAPPAPGCITYGLVRQHDAAALGVDPDTLPLPSGATDDACSPVKNADLADAIGDNYAAARANAQELNDLQANVTAQVDATAPPK
jgi:hypothetical protein